MNETEPGFQPSVFKCRKIDKFQEILVAAIPDPGSHAKGMLYVPVGHPHHKESPGCCCIITSSTIVEIRSLVPRLISQARRYVQLNLQVDPFLWGSNLISPGS